jgi:hypothetical protein
MHAREREHVPARSLDIPTLAVRIVSGLVNVEVQMHAATRSDLVGCQGQAGSAIKASKPTRVHIQVVKVDHREPTPSRDDCQIPAIARKPTLELAHRWQALLVLTPRI